MQSRIDIGLKQPDLLPKDLSRQSIVFAGAARWIGSFALVVMFVAVCYAAGGAPIFETNDDVYMCLLSAGKSVSSRPDEHLSYIHFAVGKFLVLLNSINADVPWYAITFLSVQVVSMTVIVRLLSAKVKGPIGFLFAAVFLFCACTRPVLMMQFTTTAALPSAASALLYLFAAERGKTLSLRYLLPCLGLFLLGTMIRSEVAKLTLILAFFAVFSRFCLRREYRKFVAAVISLAVAMTLSVAVDYTQRHYYAKDNWKEFYPLLTQSFSVLCRPPHPEDPQVQSACEAAGWTPQELNLFTSWYLFDAERFSVERVGKFKRAMPLLSTNVYAEPARQRLWALLKDYTTLPTLTALLIAQFVFASRRLPWRSSLVFCACTTAVLAGLYCFLHLPERVYISIITFALLIRFWYASSARIVNPMRIHAGVATNSGPKKIAIVCLVVVLGISASPLFFVFHPALQAAESEAKRLKTYIAALKPSAKDLYLNWATAFPLPTVRPFDKLDDYFKDLKMVWCGSSLRNPVAEARLRQFGLSANPLRELDRANVRLIALEEDCSVIKAFLLRHHGVVASFLPVPNQPYLSPHRVVMPFSFKIFTVSYTDARESPETDLSKRCPEFGADDLMMPGIERKTWKIKNLHIVGKNKLGTSLKARGWTATISRRKLNISTDEFSDFVIEAAADPWANQRDLHVLLTIDKTTLKRMDFTLLPDGGLHRYSFDLKKLGFAKGDRITRLTIYPLSWAPEKDAKLVIGRVAFKKKSAI